MQADYVQFLSDLAGDFQIVRASIGTLAKLGLLRAKTMAEPETAYLLTPGGCMGRCAFCPQSVDESRLSRLAWYPAKVEDMIRGQGKFKRICIQSTLRKGFVSEVERLASLFDIPVSVSVNPVHESLLERLSRHAERIGVGLDAMSPRIFREVRKPGSWKSYINFVKKSLKIFGKGKVHVHLIAGMGESFEEGLATMSSLYEMGAEVALFSFTPVKGTQMESRDKPDLIYYRTLQIARHFLSQGIPLKEAGNYDPDDYMEAFLTSGCPSCNRPFYNEEPRGPIYNFPNIEVLRNHWGRVREEAMKAIENLRIHTQRQIRRG